MPSVNLSFRAPDELLSTIQQRDPKGLKNPGSVVKRDVERWYTTLRTALKDVRLAPAEAVLLVRLVGSAGEPTEEFVAGLSWYVHSHPQEGFRHVQNNLVRKLNAYDRITMWALVDAVERYETLIRREPGCTIGMALHRVGLHTYQATAEEMAFLEGTKAVPSVDLELFGGEES